MIKIKNMIKVITDMVKVITLTILILLALYGASEIITVYKTLREFDSRRVEVVERQLGVIRSLIKDSLYWSGVYNPPPPERIKYKHLDREYEYSLIQEE